MASIANRDEARRIQGWEDARRLSRARWRRRRAEWSEWLEERRYAIAVSLLTCLRWMVRYLEARTATLETIRVGMTPAERALAMKRIVFCLEKTVWKS